MIEIRSHAPDETVAIGRRLASLLRGGDVVLLSGRLGTGKTLFAGGIAEGLGIVSPVTSPTFIIARTYRDGFLPLVHADVYRLDSLAEFDDLELVDSARDGVLLVEWGEAVAAAVPDDHLLVQLEHAGDTERVLRFAGHGRWSSRPLGDLAA